MRREAWRIERREARHTLSLDAMGTSVASTGPESDPGFALMRRCRADELAAALSRLPAVQLRRLLVYAVARLPVREIARREGCSERAVKYSLARKEADEGLVDRWGLKVAQARSAPARTGLSISGSKMIRLGDHAAGKPPRVSVPRTPP